MNNKINELFRGLYRFPFVSPAYTWRDWEAWTSWLMWQH